MADVLFEVKNLCYKNMITYGHFTIQKDKITFITGQSGAGKSTLLKLFNGVLTPSSGEIFYKGKNIDDIDTIQLRKSISLISQEVFLFDASIAENFKLFYEYRELPPLSNEKITEFLSLCCIPFPLDKDCTTMSGGERQRVYIAIFLSFLPEVIMLDEPTSALDQKISCNVMENIFSFCKNNSISVIAVSHDRELTEKFAEDQIVIERTC